MKELSAGQEGWPLWQQWWKAMNYDNWKCKNCSQCCVASWGRRPWYLGEWYWRCCWQYGRNFWAVWENSRWQKTLILMRNHKWHLYQVKGDGFQNWKKGYKCDKANLIVGYTSSLKTCVLNLDGSSPSEVMRFCLSTRWSTLSEPFGSALLFGNGVTTPLF